MLWVWIVSLFPFFFDDLLYAYPPSPSIKRKEDYQLIDFLFSYIRLSMPINHLVFLLTATALETIWEHQSCFFVNTGMASSLINFFPLTFDICHNFWRRL